MCHSHQNRMKLRHNVMTHIVQKCSKSFSTVLWIERPREIEGEGERESVKEKGQNGTAQKYGLKLCFCCCCFFHSSSVEITVLPMRRNIFRVLVSHFKLQTHINLQWHFDFGMAQPTSHSTRCVNLILWHECFHFLFFSCFLSLTSPPHHGLSLSLSLISFLFSIRQKCFPNEPNIGKFGWKLGGCVRSCCIRAQPIIVVIQILEYVFRQVYTDAPGHTFNNIRSI